jgi:aminoacyl tRNA synthase complex-interacting multifunctional protein 1
MAAVIRIPEKSGKDIVLTFKYLKAESVAKLETGSKLVLEVRKLSSKNKYHSALIK